MYINWNKPHIPIDHFDFKEPKCRPRGPLESFTEGGPTFARSEYGLKGFTWHCTVDNRKGKGKITIRRIDLAEPHLIGYVPEYQNGVYVGPLNWIDFTFDQNMRPYVVFEQAGHAAYFHLNVITSLYERVEFQDGARIHSPCVEIDSREPEDSATSDVILGYCTTDGELHTRRQTGRFGMNSDVIIARDPNKTLLWRIGFDEAGNLGFEWR